MASDQDFGKLPKLTGANDFIFWRRRIKAYIQPNDIDLIGLTNLPDDATNAQR